MLTWSDEEKCILRNTYPVQDQSDILNVLPGRTWNSICRQAFRLGVKRLIVSRSFPKDGTKNFPPLVDEKDFKGIPKAPGYFVCRDGRVWSGKTKKWLSPGINGTGYYFVMPCIQCKNTMFVIHRLVCKLFHGMPPSDLHEVRHLDGNKLNNHVNNLAWGTKSENQQDRRLHGTYQDGEKNHRAQIDSTQVLAIRSDYANGMRQSELMRKYGLTRGSVWAIVHRKTWNHI